MTIVKESNLPWIIFFSVLLVYLGFSTKNYYWDGIYFAQLIESAGSMNATLIHPNHPLYNPFGYILYKLAQTLGWGARALAILQVANCVLSAFAAVVLFFILKKCLNSVYLSFYLTLLFSFSATWWKFSTDVNSYIPSILFLLISFYFVLPGERPRPLTVAAAHTLSMCFHQLGLFFFPVAVLGIWLQTAGLTKQQRMRQVAAYIITSFLATFGIYYVSFYLQSGALNFGDLFVWLTHFSPENGFVFNLMESLTHTVRGELKLFFEGRFNFLKETMGAFTIILLTLFAAAIVGLITETYRLARDRDPDKLPKADGFRPLTLLCLVWASSYLIFLFFWIPKNTFYRMFYLPAFIILIGVLAARYRIAEKRILLLPLFVALMTISNFLFFIYPYSRVRKITPLELALQMNNIWTRETVIYYSVMESDNNLIKYFNPGTIWKNLGETGTQDLEIEIRNLYSNGGNAWIESSALEKLSRSSGGAEWLNSHTGDKLKLEDPAYNVTLIKIVP